nr:ribose-5-phosphate isomerase RpiA [Alphaproteobacteria bacterium]
MTPEEEKALVGRHAAGLVEDGMTLGLGTGSTVRHFAKALGERIAGGLSVRAITTSAQSLALAQEFAIPLTDWMETQQLDLCVDGADEVSPQFHMIKGGGAALLREKIVAAGSVRCVNMVDSTKLVQQLGTFPLPVEVVPFALEPVRRLLEEICPTVAVRMQGETPIVTDNANHIIDCHFGTIDDPAALHHQLIGIPGLVETGLFVSMIGILISTDGGEIRSATPSEGPWWAPWEGPWVA